MKNKVDVVILGKVTTLVTDESPEHVHRLARYVDNKIESLKAQNLSAVVDERLRTLFIALNLADDYFKEKDRADAFEKAANRIAKLEKENAQLKEALKNSNAELEEFINNFDTAAIKIEPENPKPEGE